MKFNGRKALRLALILSGAMLLVVAGFGLHGATTSFEFLKGHGGHWTISSRSKTDVRRGSLSTQRSSRGRERRREA